MRGEESKEQAQVQLIEHLARVAGIQLGCSILDCGCGFGGTALYLAKKFGAGVTGITISPVQVEMANKAASTENVKVKFLLMDAQAMNIDQSFDVVWSVESISHYQNRESFFASAARLLKPGGTLFICATASSAVQGGASVP